MCSWVAGRDSGANHIKTLCVYNTFGVINISCQVVIDGCFWMSRLNKCLATAECLLLQCLSDSLTKTFEVGINFLITCLLMCNSRFPNQAWFAKVAMVWSSTFDCHCSLVLGHAGMKELAYSYLLNEYWLVCGFTYVQFLFKSWRQKLHVQWYVGFFHRGSMITRPGLCPT